MTNTPIKTSLTSRQLEQCELIIKTNGTYPIWYAINTALVDIYGLDKLTDMGQGVVSKQNKLMRIISEIVDTVYVPNHFKSVDNNWNKDGYTIINENDVDKVYRLVLDIEEDN